MSLRTPLGKALGSGAAGDGVGHWWAQRLSALALIPLSVCFAVGLLGKSLQSHAAMREWLGTPWVAVLTILLVVNLAWHSKLGLEVIVEDYVHPKVARTTLLLLSTFAHAAAAAAAVFAVLMLALA